MNESLSEGNWTRSKNTQEHVNYNERMINELKCKPERINKQTDEKIIQ